MYCNSNVYLQGAYTKMHGHLIFFFRDILSAICLRFKTAKSNQVLSKQGHATVFDVFGANMSRMLSFRQQQKNDRINRAQLCGQEYHESLKNDGKKNQRAVN